MWPGVLVTVAVFVMMHLPGWNPAHVFGVVLPLGLILAGLYVWRRNLWLLVIVHLLIDLPLFIMAVAT